MKLVSLISFRRPRTNEALQKPLNSIHMYPALRVESCAADATLLALTECCRAAWISAHAATTEDKTMRPNKKRFIGVTKPPNQSTFVGDDDDV